VSTWTRSSSLRTPENGEFCRISRAHGVGDVSTSRTRSVGPLSSLAHCSSQYAACPPTSRSGRLAVALPRDAAGLPTTADPVPRRGGALPAFFTGLLPEGRRLGALRRAVKTSADDELSLLLAVGGDAVGDVQVVPAGALPDTVPVRLQVDAGLSQVRVRLLTGPARRRCRRRAAIRRATSR
jgi:hypothetical protein